MNATAPTLPFQDKSLAVSSDGITGSMHLMGKNSIGNPIYRFYFVDSLGNICHRVLNCPFHYARYTPAA